MRSVITHGYHETLHKQTIFVTPEYIQEQT